MGDGHFEQLQSLLHAGSAGDGKPGGARDDRPAKPGTVSGGNYGVLAPGLSQLTDLLLEHARAPLAPPAAARPAGPSAEQARAAASGAAVPSFLPLTNVDFASMQSNPELFASLAAWALPATHLPQLGTPSEEGVEGVGYGALSGGGLGPGSARRSARPTRRGPMDEMRQLVRILLKLLPHSVGHIGGGEEAGGGNRISEEQIKTYLDATLGEAPRPTWGVPGGWHSYVAVLLSWATGKAVSEEAAKRVAKREPGRSWEALESELAALGAHPNCWPLPLTLEGVRAAEADPRASELETWRHLLDVLRGLEEKAGTAPAESGAELAAARAEARARLEGILALAPGAPAAGLNLGMFSGLQYVPVLGMDGGSGMLTLLGGLGGLPVQAVQAQQAQHGGEAAHAVLAPPAAGEPGGAEAGAAGPGVPAPSFASLATVVPSTTLSAGALQQPTGKEGDALDPASKRSRTGNIPEGLHSGIENGDAHARQQAKVCFD
ncbi:hypothetical protein QBZ16_002839 [Prototheca wickerhamii]|uniref:Uncharacterized protein n=1 Tax=Prototheca wickerhamii TaxID=3111 RepID=A0AAD9IIX2_PROWI|nr:hypothetical protein QBZ16_002839 [Prototheca wickerhamii]